MNCPNCGKEMKEGKLYCEFCGQEIQMVPDFEPEIEIEIEESLMTVAESLAEPSMAHTKKMDALFNTDTKLSSLLDKEYQPEEDEEENLEYSDEVMADDDFWDVNEAIDLSKGTAAWSHLVSKLKHSKRAKVLASVTAVMLFIFIIGAVLLIIGSVRSNSYDYQYKNAMECFQNGDYSKAAEHMERALAIDNSDKDALLSLADFYNKGGETDNAILVLKEVVAYNGDNVMEAYTQLFQIYTELGLYGQIKEVLLACDDPKVIETFQQYLALNPEFSIEEGLYHDVQHLKLTANTSGIIYYTTDGSMPSTNSEIYTSPIYLESGFITVKAMFINDFGQVSDVVSKKYEIDVVVPKEPSVMPESGEFVLPSLISVEVPENCKVFYTIDGTDPTTEDEEYTEPMCMPMGKTDFAFVIISEDNISSTIVKRTYTLNMETVITAAEAANMVTNYRFSLGGLTDTEGHLVTVPGRLMYMCKGAVTISEQAYYFVGEYYEDPNSMIQTRTGLTYGVNVLDGQIVSIELDELGNYYAVEAVSEPTIQ